MPTIETIRLPKDPKRRKQLKAKLKEYDQRLKPYEAPEGHMDTICKTSLLSAVLESAEGSDEIRTEEVEKQLRARYGTSFSAYAFQRACVVIADYCETGGQNVVCGRLPEILVEEPA